MPSPHDALLGAAGAPVECRRVGDISVHWYPSGAKVGDPCLCGAKRRELAMVADPEATRKGPPPK